MTHIVQMDFEESINQYMIKKTFCICCLKHTGEYIKLATCTHKEYLDSFPISNLSSSIPDTVCYKCHDILKKVTQFKLQVQHSCDILLKKVDNFEKSDHVKSNLQISKIIHYNIPELTEHIEETQEVKQQKLTKNKNIETALEILNRNTRSLQTFASYQSILGLTETLLGETNNGFNFPTMSGTVLPVSKINCSHNGTSVLPVEIKKESDVKTDIERNNTIEKEQTAQDEIKKETEIDNQQSSTNANNVTVRVYTHLSHKGILLPEYDNKNPKTDDISKKNNTITINSKQKENSEYENTVLPIENITPIKESNDVDIVSICGTAVLPDRIKCDPEDLNSNLTTLENGFENHEQKKNKIINSSTTNQNIVNDGVGLPKKRPTLELPSLCLIPIKLSKKTLQEERREKLTSSEFLQWEYRCELCVIGFLFKENFDDHIKRKHVMKYPGSHITCQICQQVVYRDDVGEHKFRHYNRLECQKCKKRFVLFDEAYDHYHSVHTPLRNKLIIKRQLKMYWRSKRLGASKRKTSGSNSEIAALEGVTSTQTTFEPSTDVTETPPDIMS